MWAHARHTKLSPDLKALNSVCFVTTVIQLATTALHSFTQLQVNE